jgi:hypothetical protein
MPTADLERSDAYLQLVDDLKPSTSRENVHSTLGSPYQTNEELRIELYRLTGEPHGHKPLNPLPYEYTMISFILVLYDDNWKIKSAKGDYDVHGYSSSDINIQLDGYRLVKLSSTDNPLLIAPFTVSEQATMKTPPGDICYLFINIPEESINRPFASVRWLFLDNKQILDFSEFWGINTIYPNKEIISESLFVRMEISKGPHTLELRSEHKIEGEVETEFQCSGSKSIVANINAKISHPKLQTKDYLEGKISINDIASGTLKGRRQVLFHHGKWIK